VTNNEIDDNKNSGELLVILMAMRMQQYNAGRIAQWSTSHTLLEATGCHHWASACTAFAPAATKVIDFG
jgi:hypothetical protein